jgi:C4-dicarboxylate transporter
VVGFDHFSDHRPLTIFNLIGYEAQTLSFLFRVDSPLYNGEFIPHMNSSQAELEKRLPAFWRVLPVAPSMISIVGIKESGSRSVADAATTILVRT